MIKFSEEQAMLLASAQSFCKDKSPFSVVRHQITQPTGFDAGLWKEIVALGWTSLAIPEALGGSGLSLAEAATIAEPMGRHLLATPFASTQLFTQGLITGASQAQQQRFLPSICNGSVATVALFEPEGDWDLERVSATAQLSADSSSYTLSGVKTLVCDAHVAELILVSVAVNGAPSLAILSKHELTADLKEQALQREVIVDETRRAFSLNLQGIQLPAEQLINGASATNALRSIRNAALLLYSAEAAGGIAGALDVIVDYLNTRTTFGRKIGSYQSLKHTSAEILISLERSRSHLYHAATLLSESDPAFGARAEVALRMAKVEAGEGFVFAGDRAVQFHGGFGFTYECNAQLYLRRAMWIQSAFGDAAHHRRRLGDALLNAA